MKSNRKPPHDQARADRLARTMRSISTPMSEADYLRAVFGNKSERTSGVFLLEVAHDDWCRTMKTGNGSDCNCNPVISHRKFDE